MKRLRLAQIRWLLCLSLLASALMPAWRLLFTELGIPALSAQVCMGMVSSQAQPQPDRPAQPGLSAMDACTWCTASLPALVVPAANFWKAPRILAGRWHVVWHLSGASRVFSAVVAQPGAPPWAA
jgi:hypothetical protein